LKPVRIGIVGVGKIAADQHIPALRASQAFELAACASRNARVDGVDNFPDLAAMLDGRPDLEAIAICTPPQVHYEAAKLALARGKHVLLEKPPCATTRQLADLAARAAAARRTLFQTWHSRYASGVARAREWLGARTILSGRIAWKEDVRQWHPGQTWIWRAGGFGVFDPGINAISILTEIAPVEMFVSAAKLFVPSNCEAPIAADVTFVAETGARIEAEFDFRQTGPQTWDIELQTNDGALTLSMGGAVLGIDGERIGTDGEGEYPALYRRFAALIERGVCDVDARPFELTADAFLIGAREAVDPFTE
jgi:predicted dehydrogenase